MQTHKIAYQLLIEGFSCSLYPVVDLHSISHAFASVCGSAFLGIFILFIAAFAVASKLNMRAGMHNAFTTCFAGPAHGERRGMQPQGQTQEFTFIRAAQSAA
jgi:hypothetical protein